MPDCPAMRYLMACDAVALIDPGFQPWVMDALYLLMADALEELRAELAK